MILIENGIVQSASRAKKTLVCIVTRGDSIHEGVVYLSCSRNGLVSFILTDKLGAQIGVGAEFKCCPRFSCLPYYCRDGATGERRTSGGSETLRGKKSRAFNDIC